MTHKKLVVLGGSSFSTPALFAALANQPNLVFDEVCLVGRTPQQLEEVGRFSCLLMEHVRHPTRISWDTDLGRAARGARYVLNTLRVGGVEGQVADRARLAMSGVVGHASSYGEALRNLPVTLDAVGVLEATAPDAIVINFTNPVSVLCEAIAIESRLRCIGICHHAFSMREDFAALLNVPLDQVRVEYFGLNHVGWVTDVQVAGRSQMARLCDILVTRRDKNYNYGVIQPFGIIPIKHASSLYHKGDIVNVREQGIRGSLADALCKSSSRLVVDHLRQAQDAVRAAIVAGNLEVVKRLTARAPWYARCIVPFLDALDSGHPSEFIVTWRHGGRVAGLPGLTGESLGVIEQGQVRPAPTGSRLSAFAEAWLRQIRDSEHLLIRAAREQSFRTAVEAMAIHPNVASVRHAQRYMRTYLPDETARV